MTAKVAAGQDSATPPSPASWSHAADARAVAMPPHRHISTGRDSACCGDCCHDRVRGAGGSPWAGASGGHIWTANSILPLMRAIDFQVLPAFTTALPPRPCTYRIVWIADHSRVQTDMTFVYLRGYVGGFSEDDLPHLRQVVL